MSVLWYKSYDINLTIRSYNVYFHIPIKETKPRFVLVPVDKTDTVRQLKKQFYHNEKVLKILPSAQSTYRYLTERAQVCMDFQSANQC